MNPGYKKGYYARNRERLIREAVEWAQTNREQRNANSRRYYANNTEAHAARVKAWYDANQDTVRRNGRRYEARRRALKAGLPTEDFTLEEIFQRDGWLCQLCGEPVEPPTPRSSRSASLDHIIPISDPTCPGHIRSNVQTTHLGCNARKKDKTK